VTYFVTSALTQGQSETFNIDETWSVSTFDYVWSNGTDSTRQADIFGSVDEGQHWFEIVSISSSALAASQQSFNADCVNAIKVQNTTAATGNTLTVRFTGK
jgi:hypothetical protein